MYVGLSPPPHSHPSLDEVNDVAEEREEGWVLEEEDDSDYVEVGVEG